MFKQGQLLKFTPFSFKNGANPKPKYFIVLGRLKEDVVIASLPTSKDHIPNTINIGSGCINDIERNVNAYIFSEDILVTDTFSFPRKTFVYAEQVDEYSCDYLSNMHSNIVNLGQIFPELLNSLIDCLQSSCMLKRKYRNVLSAPYIRKQSF